MKIKNVNVDNLTTSYISVWIVKWYHCYGKLFFSFFFKTLNTDLQNNLPIKILGISLGKLEVIDQAKPYLKNYIAVLFNNKNISNYTNLW